MLMTEAKIAELWKKSCAELGTQFAQRSPSGVFLEGSLAEGFGNDRSDVDFVAVIDDGIELPTMPYILFVNRRRVEVRLVSAMRLRQELAEVATAVRAGRGAICRLPWNLLERCQRLIGARPIHGHARIASLQAELGRAALGTAVAAWFESFAREAARYAVAMSTLEQAGYAQAWIKTAVFHAAKGLVARLGEHYMSPKWLSLQLERAAVDDDVRQRIWVFLHEPHQPTVESDYVERGIGIIRALGVGGVQLDPAKVLVGARRQVTTWQIGDRVHVLRGEDMFVLDDGAASLWRSIRYGDSCREIAGRGPVKERGRRLGLLSDLSKAGLISLTWKNGGEIKARQHGTSAVLDHTPIISRKGARLRAIGREGFELLPIPARRFVEAGLEMTWAHIGLENAREDALGAFKRGQWRVLEYALQRMLQTGCMVALGAYGVTPQPPLEEATLDAMRRLPFSAALRRSIARIESSSINSARVATARLKMTEKAVLAIQRIAGEIDFPASFDSASGWSGTILTAYDWINIGGNLDVRFPQTAHGGHGTAEEARDLLASSIA